jgi:hypothetical protein
MWPIAAGVTAVTFVPGGAILVSEGKTDAVRGVGWGLIGAGALLTGLWVYLGLTAPRRSPP